MPHEWFQSTPPRRGRLQVVTRTDKRTLQGFVSERVSDDADVFTDDAGAYVGLANRQVVRYTEGEYVNGHVHTNGIESFWSMLKRAHKGTFHKLSAKHLQRYVNEFAGRHNMRSLDTIDQMATVTVGLMGKRLTYEALIAPNGLPSGARG